MGATQFTTRSSGKTIADAYNNACDRANVEEGIQEGYNGTISTTDGYRDETELYKKSKFNSIRDYIDNRYDDMKKRQCSAICISQPIGNNNKIKSQVEHVVEAGTKKWILKYEVISTGWEGLSIGSYLTKGEAVVKAREYTEKTTNPTAIRMIKVLEKYSPITAKISYKKATTERIGEWIFFGWAAE